MRMFGSRMNLIPFVLVLFVFQSCATSDFLKTGESLEWAPPNDFAPVQRISTGWKGITGDYTYRTIYLRRTDTDESWRVRSESLQLPIAATSSGAFHWNPDSVMSWLKASVEKNCSTADWKILDKDDTSMLYEWENISCAAWPTQHEIVRIVLGKWYVWIISFGVRDISWSALEKDMLIANLRDAKVGARGTAK
jgi:hypothetical protein